MPRTRTKKKTPSRASTADKYALYERAVQDPKAEIRFMDNTFRALRKHTPLRMREDFCGTAVLAKAWAKRSPAHFATGIDLDAKVLAYAKAQHLAEVPDVAERVTLLKQNVLDPAPGKFDIVCAFNFSYWIFRTRLAMRDYFKKARQSLTQKGALYLDVYGGWESHEPMLEPRRIGNGVTYVWDQASFDPITNYIRNHIHFEFTDGSELHEAFTYDWRFWSIPELSEILQEAGFSEVIVYWDTGEDDDREAFRIRKRAPNQPGFLAYLVALR